MTERERDAEDAILIEVRSGSTTPGELIKAVKNSHNEISEITLREALWRLISQHQINLSTDRKLRVAQLTQD